MKMPPEVLRLSGDSSSATFKRLWQRLWLATMIFRKWPSTMPRSPGLGLPHPPSPKSRPCPPVNSGPDRRGMPWATAPYPLGLCSHGPATPPRTAQNPGRGASLPRLKKRPVQALYRPCNSGIIRRLCRDGASKPVQDDNIGRRQIIPQKNKPLRKPLEPPHGTA